MAFRHGVYKSEVPTSLVSPMQGESGLPVFVGASPVFLGDARNVNKPVLCSTYTEAVKALGYSSSGWEDWTLSEAMYSQFALFGQSPAVFINVFDPSKHKEQVSDETHTVTDNEINLGKNIIISAGFTFKDSEGEAITGIEHEADYDDEGNAILTLSGTSIPASIKVSYTKAKPSLVTENDIIGGIDANTGEAKGLELINSVYPKFRLIPGIIVVPKWSGKPSVASVMKAKSENINGLFTCISIVDIPADTNRSYTSAVSAKSAGSYGNERQVVCWPMVKSGDKVFHLSTQLAGLMNATDRNAGDVPYISPSNKQLQCDSAVLSDGTEITLGADTANYLNAQGIVTAINFASGWVAWGNRTGAYPASTDPKDSFISVKRMFDFVGNTFITSFWGNGLDQPLTPRLIRTIVDSFNVYLNGLSAREMLLGGRIEFLESENPATALQDGTLTFHVYMTPPVPAEVIEGVFEFDTSYLSSLVSALG